MLQVQSRECKAFISGVFADMSNLLRKRFGVVVTIRTFLRKIILSVFCEGNLKSALPSTNTCSICNLKHLGGKRENVLEQKWMEEIFNTYTEFSDYKDDRYSGHYYFSSLENVLWIPYVYFLDNAHGGTWLN